MKIKLLKLLGINNISELICDNIDSISKSVKSQYSKTNCELLPPRYLPLLPITTDGGIDYDNIILDTEFIKCVPRTELARLLLLIKDITTVVGDYNSVNIYYNGELLYSIRGTSRVCYYILSSYSLLLNVNNYCDFKINLIRNESEYVCNPYSDYAFQLVRVNFRFGVVYKNSQGVQYIHTEFGIISISLIMSLINIDFINEIYVMGNLKDQAGVASAWWYRIDNIKRCDFNDIITTINEGITMSICKIRHSEIHTDEYIIIEYFYILSNRNIGYIGIYGVEDYNKLIISGEIPRYIII